MTGARDIHGVIRTSVLALVLTAACSSPATSNNAANPVRVADQPGVASGTVTKVTDGDTVHVGVLGQDVDVRVLGVDTPETVKPGVPVQCGGPQASAFAHQLLDGQYVHLVPDPTQGLTDRYHRALRYVRLNDGRDYSLLVVTAGWARVYTYQHKPVSEYAALEQAQKAAVVAKRGLWGLCPNPAPGD